MKRLLLLILILLNCYTCLAEFEIHFLDVGQGNAAIIVCDGEYMLIDGGKASSSQLMYSYLKNTLGAEHLSYIISTHPHEDHVGGIAGALNACTAGVIYTPVPEWDSKAFNSMLKYAGEADVRIPYPGESFMLGTASVEMLGPLREYYDTNDLSIVTRITYGQTVFLFMGDAEYTAEYELIDYWDDLDANVLVVGHHGSYTSTTYQLLWAVEPEYAVISVGKGNSYGHPAEATITKLQDIGCIIYRTDESGHIICHSDGMEIWFETEK